MEWLGLLALGLMLCYSSYPGRVKRLEAAMKKLDRRQKGGSDMSKLIGELVGKSCKIRAEDMIEALNCRVLDADDEWLRISYTDKKQRRITKLLRIDRINEVEELQDTDI